MRRGRRGVVLILTDTIMKDIMPDLTLDEINQLCKDIAEVTMADEVAQNMAALDEEENELMALSQWRNWGPDFDEGANDCDGEFYWDK